MKNLDQQRSVDRMDTKIHLDQQITVLVLGRNRLFLQAR
jgi:hypothetical protein